MFYVQPSQVFGTQICDELTLLQEKKLKWLRFEFAVAWTNLSGAQSLYEAIRKFLNSGAQVRATVGLDFSSTSYEGLTLLLDLEKEGDIQTKVFFDENRACTFHPKVYLFSNEQSASLYVGSNNMTGAGLNTNIEASLKITRDLSDETVQQAKSALKGWRNEDDLRCKILTPTFLDLLKKEGYVQTEEEIRKSRKANSKARNSRKRALFGKSAVITNKKKYQDPRNDWEGTELDNSVLLMRVKPRRNGKQIQFSMRVFEHPFMENTTAVVSSKSKKRREIGFNYTSRKGKSEKNTARFEAPELIGVSNPIARLSWQEINGTPEKVLQYEIFEGNIGEGKKLFDLLKQRIKSPPTTNLSKLSSEETVLSKSDLEIAQWYLLYDK